MICIIYISVLSHVDIDLYFATYRTMYLLLLLICIVPYMLYNPLWEYIQGHSFLSYIINICSYVRRHNYHPLTSYISIALLVLNTATGATSHQLWSSLASCAWHLTTPTLKNIRLFTFRWANINIPAREYIYFSTISVFLVLFIGAYCLYIYIYIYICIYLHICRPTHTHTHTHIYILPHSSVTAFRLSIWYQYADTALYELSTDFQSANNLLFNHIHTVTTIH